MNKKEQIGSSTAKGGFKNEQKICNKFNNYQNDNEAQKWLKEMGYDCNKIQSLEANQIPVKIKDETLLEYGITNTKIDETKTYQKADAQVVIKIKIEDIIYRENLSLKKYNKGASYNQIDKRSVSKYTTMWSIPNEVSTLLKYFTGAINPSKYHKKHSNKRRLYITDFTEDEQDLILSFFDKNKQIILMDILKGRGFFAVEWMLVTEKSNNGNYNWCLKNINDVINHYLGEVKISPRGSIKIGKITIQRKGGTPDPESLQFKFSPQEVFKIQ